MRSPPADLGTDDQCAAGRAGQVFAAVDAQVVLKLTFVTDAVQIIAERRAIAADTFVNDEIDRFVESGYLWQGQLMSPLLRVQPRPGQTFIHIDITKPTDKSLIQQHTLDLAFALGQSCR